MLVTTILTGMAITWLALLLLKPVAKRASLLDIPKGRKQHNGNVPLIGGLSIFLGVSFTVITLLPMDSSISAWVLCALGIVLLGVADDAEDLPVRLRIVMQTLLTIAMCLGSQVYLESLGNIVGLGDLNLGWLGYLLSIIVVIGIINAFNMIDGIDGLLGSLSLVSFGSLTILFYDSNHIIGFYIALIFISAILPYLLNNLVVYPFKEKIFMGDAGSMLIGLSLSWLLLLGTQLPNTMHTSTFRPVTALWLIAIPVMDMMRVTITRLLKRQSPFAAGRDHMHHILLKAGLNKHQTLALVTIVAVVFATIGLVGEEFHIYEVVLFLGWCATFVGFFIGINQLEQAGTDCLKPWLQGKLLATFTQTAQKTPARFGNN